VEWIGGEGGVRGEGWARGKVRRGVGLGGWAWVLRGGLGDVRGGCGDFMEID